MSVIKINAKLERLAATLGVLQKLHERVGSICGLDYILADVYTAFNDLVSDELKLRNSYGDIL